MKGSDSGASTLKRKLKTWQRHHTGSLVYKTHVYSWQANTISAILRWHTPVGNRTGMTNSTLILTLLWSFLLRCVVWTGDDRVFFFNPTIQLSVWDQPVDLKHRGEDLNRIIENPPHKRKNDSLSSKFVVILPRWLVFIPPFSWASLGLFFMLNRVFTRPWLSMEPRSSLSVRYFSNDVNKHVFLVIC